MIRIRVTTKTIVQWTNSGLTYRDTKGRPKQIEFSECRQNFVKHVLESGDFPHRSGDVSSIRCVAWRDATAKPPYIEFFTEPRMRFEFDQPKNWLSGLLQPAKRRWYSSFQDMQQQTSAMGWTSYDLT
jgi:hypothetical protein